MTRKEEIFGSEHWKRYLKENGIFGTWDKSLWCLYHWMKHKKFRLKNHDYNTVVVDIDGEICY